MTGARPEIESKTIKCPFCQKGDIRVTLTSDWYSEGRARAAGRSAMIPHYHPPRTEIHNKCPECGKSKSELKEAIERGTTKMPSHEEQIKRIRNAGIPTNVEFKME